MTDRTIYYFGPELTFSHQAADLVRAQQPAWAGVPLQAAPSPAAIFERVVQEPQSGAIVPFYNHVQGWVYDFLRFFLLDQIAQLDLPIRYGLFAGQPHIKEVQRIYTKDTVIPQVSEWLDAHAAGITLIASHEMSTADAAMRAAADPQGAAICARAAGEAHHLTLLADVPSNISGNFTRFGLFARPAAWWEPPAGALAPVEHPLHFNDALWRQITLGQATFFWPLTLKPNTTLHLGHLSILLTLRKFGRWGNRLVVVLDRGEADTHLVNNYRQHLLIVMGEMMLETLGVDDPIDDSWIQVDGLEALLTLREGQRPAVLLDYVPGLDGYAKMSTSRQNTASWPLNGFDSAQMRRLREVHFTPERLAMAAFDWTDGPLK